MKRLAIAAAALAGVVAIIAGIGASVPREHVATVRIEIAAELDAVQATIADVDGYPRWRKEVKSVEWKDDETWIEKGPEGDLTLRWIERGSIARIADPDLPFSGQWSYELYALDDSVTALTITEEGAIDSVFVRFFAYVLMDEYASAERFASQLAEELGSEAKPQRLTVVAN